MVLLFYMCLTVVVERWRSETMEFSANYDNAGKAFAVSDRDISYANVYLVSFIKFVSEDIDFQLQ